MEKIGVDEPNKKKKVLKITIIVLAVLLVIAIAGLTTYFCLTYKKTI